MIYIYIGLAIALLILVLILPYLFRGKRDKFAPTSLPAPVQYDDDYYDPAFNTHTNFAFWNTQRGTKRGMSYDIRGDVPIGQRQWFPFNMSSISPIVNKPLYTVS